LTIEEKKLSTSRNWAIWLPDYLENYDPDALRYVLSINMPETGDTDFSWREFLRRNNDELVATYGNLVHRTLTFTKRNFNGTIPAPGEIDSQTGELLDKVESTLSAVGKSISGCRFKESIRNAMALAQDANRYLDDKAPWKAIKQDREAAALGVYGALSVISGLKTILYPFMPFSSQRLHEFLGFRGTIEQDGWQFVRPVAGRELPDPQPLFSKLDDSIVDEEMSHLGTENGSE
jgi:methionyl-tRNA synthetase